jgi:hypothetical protein
MDDLGSAPGSDASTVPDRVIPLPDSSVPGEDVTVRFDALPPIDATPRADVIIRNDCPDAAATLIYLMTEEEILFSFDPASLSFKRIGKIVCPAVGSQTPFSMAVDRTGIAYVVYTDGNLYRVSTATAACIATSFVPDQQGFRTFGMGFVSNTGGPAETLFVAEDTLSRVPTPVSRGLASIDTTSFALSFVAPFSRPIPYAELTGTGDGRLFGFYTNAQGTGSHIFEIDKTNGVVLAQNDLVVGQPDDAFAFAFYGGDFWVFTSPGGGVSTVTHFSPATLSENNVGTLSATIVGAGVSTCAPE